MIDTQNPTRKLRVLVLDNSPQLTGALNSMITVSDHLSGSAEFIFVLPANSKVTKHLDRIVYTCRMVELNRQLSSWLVYPFYLLRNALFVQRIIRRHKIDMVHGNDLYNLIPVCLKFFGSRTPYVVYIRLLSGKFPPIIYNTWVRLHLRFAERAICVSHSVRKQFQPNKKLLTIHDPLPRFMKSSRQRDEKPVILYLANVIRGKGQEMAIKAFSMIHHNFPLFTLKFVGSDMGLEKNKAFLGELKSLAERLGISDKITWQGFTENVGREFETACIALNFSESESFSMTCLEALYFGCPIVATDSGGPSEIIDNGQTGFLVPVSDINEMARSMDKLLRDEDLRGRFSREGILRVTAKFSEANTSRRIMDCYQEVLRGMQ